MKRRSSRKVVRLTPELAEALAFLSERKNLSESTLLQVAWQEYVERNYQPAPSAAGGG